ncbi:alpha/beta hydrolase [Spongiivirga sp. MCCC 1A20706]|uniref:alpha/beta hydrolase family protein n=1 Tax=Spongiivirga sp. MCCC 1A20706 TaxID=3160963 RepID=UPI0039775A27
MTHISITTEDGQDICATYFKPEKPTNKTVVIAGGVGLPQRFFFKFASWLATKGCDAYTFDYRGIALSKDKELTEFHAGYFEWTNYDFKGITSHIKSVHPENNNYLIGHSFGGNSLGMSTAYKCYDKFLFVGSQFGYYRNFPWYMQISILLGFGLFVGFITPLYGYFPSKLVGLGEPLPKQVAYDWRTLLLHKNSVLALAKDHNYYSEITQPTLMISIDDDNFAPKKAVDTLAEHVFVNAKVKRKHLEVKKLGIKKLGHNNFFRKKHEHLLWPIVSNWFQINTTTT